MIDIKREKVLDILDKMQFFQGQRAGRELWFGKPTEVQEQDCENFTRDIRTIRDFILQLEAQPKVGEWIPVSERLPSEKETWDYNEEEGIYEPNEFIVMIKGATIPTVLFYDTNFEEWSDGDNDVYEVIAWQPLPEPYRKDVE